MSETMPTDILQTAMLGHVYYVVGNPMHLFDLERVNFREAHVIFVAQCKGVDEDEDEAMADAESVCLTRFIETHLKAGGEFDQGLAQEEGEDMFATGPVVDGPIVITELIRDP